MSNPLNEMSPAELGKLFPIQVVQYNPQWKEIFRTEKRKIEKIVDKFDLVSIEHIGSTAIPGLSAKPIVDIMLQVNTSTNLKNLRTNFEKLEYHYTDQPDNPPPCMTFFKGYTPEGFKGQAYHVHVRYPGVWHEITFRDYLLNHHDQAKAYEDLKLQLAEKHRFNREDYTNAKSDFIKAALKKANSKA